MPFPKHLREEALVRSQRHCCVCHDFAGRAINVHHIIQESDGGPNTLENAIVLCLRCHSEAGHFNPRHPIGTSYSPAELIRHRDLWWEACRSGTARYSFSVQAEVKRTVTESELHTYKLLIAISNGNQHAISDYKLDVFLPSAIKVRVQDIDDLGDVRIEGMAYQKFQIDGVGKIFLGEERELIESEFRTLEYDIDYKVFSSSRCTDNSIRWTLYTDVEPVRHGVITWDEMQQF